MTKRVRKPRKLRNEFIVHSDYVDIILRNNKRVVVAVTKVDLDDFDRVKEYCWHFSGKYARGLVGGVEVALHRFILAVSGKGEVDHINRDKLDNRKSNLRIVNRQQNQMNVAPRKDSLTGLKGVSPHRDKFQARIYVNGSQNFLGVFDTQEEAALAYDRAAEELFGEVAFKNLTDRGNCYV